MKKPLTRQWCLEAPLTEETAPEFLDDLLTESSESRTREHSLLTKVQGQLRDETALNTQGQDSPAERNDIFFAEGDTFPSLRIRRETEQIEVRLDPHLRSLSISRLTKVAISPNGHFVALVGDVPTIKTSLLVLLETGTLTSHPVSENVYDAVWGDSSNLFFSTLQNQRPSAIYHHVPSGTPRLVRTSSSSQALLLSKSRDGSHVFIEASGPTKVELFALSSKSEFKEIFSRSREPLGARATAIRDSIFLLSYRDNRAGTITKFNPVNGSSPKIVFRGTSDAPITNVDSNKGQLIIFHSLGTRTSLTILGEDHSSPRTIPALGPVSTLTPSPPVISGPERGMLVSSFLNPTRHLSVSQLESWRSEPASQYGSEYSFEVKSTNGASIPVSLVSPSRPQGVLIFVYGSYGRPFPATNSPYIMTLLKNNIAIAIAHVRGGGEKGPGWHRAGTGKYRDKAIDDLLAVIRDLHARGIGDPTSTAVEGRSAGAWLVAMAAIRAPELITSVILEAPFLNIPSLGNASSMPLTEWDAADWGTNVVELSPLKGMRKDFRAKTLTLIPIRDQLVPMSTTLEWIRHGRCTTNSPQNFRTVLLSGETHEGPITHYDETETFATKVVFLLQTIAHDFEL